MDGVNSVIRAPNVLDNLIYRREIPTMIAVFINPGRTPSSRSRHHRLGRPLDEPAGQQKLSP